MSSNHLPASWDLAQGASVMGLERESVMGSVMGSERALGLEEASCILVLGRAGALALAKAKEANSRTWGQVGLDLDRSHK